MDSSNIYSDGPVPKGLEELAKAVDRKLNTDGVPDHLEVKSQEDIVANLYAELADAKTSMPNDLDRRPGESYSKHLRRRLKRKPVGAR